MPPDIKREKSRFDNLFLEIKSWIEHFGMAIEVKRIMGIRAPPRSLALLLCLTTHALPPRHTQYRKVKIYSMVPNTFKQHLRVWVWVWVGASERVSAILLCSIAASTQHPCAHSLCFPTVLPTHNSQCV